ncbi:uracil-DNA glycosylase family protein [Pseudoflavitalea rhizosphaerae]|uniref:uracil-DNA glycosylase family protein n=1 Tax=Pseudoflavitalea rhizosphaerae TaxID=1884793 RepID=UPI000F8EDC90|nr:uracil-DNA glycosylase family protein [Pseudoflavitalea rhizosphaerae]
MTAKLTQSYAILKFLKNLRPDFHLPEGVAIMNPFTNNDSSALATIFYNKFYNDHHPRKFIFGINPGRFGAGVTGVPFTDPIRLQEDCGIPNDLPKKAELSSIFIYDVIKRYGGVHAFYKDFFITALSPLGFTKNGLNLNYYDDKELLKASEPFIIDTILKTKKEILTETNTCFCLGEGTNFKIFRQLNKKHQLFEKIIPLPHPRFIMQYKRKQVGEFTDEYVRRLREV